MQVSLLVLCPNSHSDAALDICPGPPPLASTPSHGTLAALFATLDISSHSFLLRQTRKQLTTTLEFFVVDDECQPRKSLREAIGLCIEPEETDR